MQLFICYNAHWNSGKIFMVKEASILNHSNLYLIITIKTRKNINFFYQTPIWDIESEKKIYHGAHWFDEISKTDAVETLK